MDILYLRSNTAADHNQTWLSMKYFTFLTVFVLVSYAVQARSAQDTDTIDSLERALAQHTKDDEDKVAVLKDLSFAYSRVDPRKGLQYADQLMELAGRLGHPTHQAAGYGTRANSLAVLGEDSLARVAYQQAIQLYKDNGEEYQAALSSFNLSVLYNNVGMYREALAAAEEAYEIIKNGDNKAHHAAILRGLGVCHFYLGNHLIAIDYYYKGIEVAESIQDHLEAGQLYTNIGLIYKRLGKYEEAIEVYQKADSMIVASSDMPSRVNLLGNMASAYDSMGETEKAIGLYEKALALATDIGFKRGEATNLTNLGVAYCDTGDYVRAMDYFNRGFAIYEQSPNYAAIALIYRYQANILVEASSAQLEQMGIAPGNRLGQALELATKALEIAQEIENPLTEYPIYYSLSVIYEQQHRYQEALDAHKAYVEIRDRLIGEEQKEEVVRLEMEYEMGRRDALAAAEIQQHKTTRNTIIAGSALLFLIGVGGLVAYKKRQDGLKKQSELAFRASLSETEMKVLRLQMNPHFIFNSLNSISDYISKNDLESADYYLAKFAKLMRGILESSEEQEIPLADELQLLHLYMQLEASRLAGKFTHEITVGAGIDTQETLVPPLILQPFVENSIWHGLSRKKGQGKIKIEVTRDGDMINCAVEDDGVGRSPHHAKNGHKSYGTSITKDRIDMLNRLKDTQASIHIVDLEQGTRVEVKLPAGEL